MHVIHVGMAWRRTGTWSRRCTWRARSRRRRRRGRRSSSRSTAASSWPPATRASSATSDRLTTGINLVWKWTALHVVTLTRWKSNVVVERSFLNSTMSIVHSHVLDRAHVLLMINSKRIDYTRSIAPECWTWARGVVICWKLYIYIIHVGEAVCRWESSGGY